MPKCSLKYQDLAFSYLFLIAQKFNGHQRRKSTLPSSRKAGQRRFVSIPFKFSQMQGIGLQTSADIRNAWGLVSDCWVPAPAFRFSRLGVEPGNFTFLMFPGDVEVTGLGACFENP